MEKGLILLLLIGLITHTVLGQIVCGYEQTDALESKTTRYIENGGVFTPLCWICNPTRYTIRICNPPTFSL